MKTIEEYFIDWEAHVFGYGYGTGEEYTIEALKQFLMCIPDKGTYDYCELEKDCTPPIAWLLINILCNSTVNIIEYGTSPRFGWLTAEGKALKDFVCSNTVLDMRNILSYNEKYIHCYPDHCNCDDKSCDNPFWKTRHSVDKSNDL